MRIGGLAGCKPIRSPKNQLERIHSYFRRVVDDAAVMSSDPQNAWEARRSTITLYVLQSEISNDGTFLDKGTDSYVVPMTHRLLIHKLSTYISSYSFNIAASAPAENRLGEIYRNAMHAMMSLTNMSRGTGGGSKLVVGDPAVNPQQLNMATFLNGVGGPILDFGDLPYIALPGEELKLTVGGPTFSVGLGTQFGVLLDVELVPTNEMASRTDEVAQ